jgi:hypothetical protein
MLENTERAIKNGQSRETTQGTQDEEKQNKNTTQYVLDTTIRKEICLSVHLFCRGSCFIYAL